MADHQRVIEFLRDVRQGGPGGLQGVTEEITQMAGAYAELCVQANERLRQCSTFLQQGLRSEAVHLADQQPNLLDLVAQLDLPDPQVWVDFCQNNGLPVPPPLQMERAAQLNDAYAQDQPMEHLLSRHRLLALARAPLKERLGVMRQIAKLDPGSPYWEKDIRGFEAARLKELPGAFHAAVKNHDNRAITQLMDEVNRQAWYELVPTDLAKGVAEAFARMQRSAAEAELKQLVEPLRDAFAARSLQECQALAQRWKNILARAGVTSVGDELNDEIKPVLAFIAEQTGRDDIARKFKEGCRAFGKMLDQDAADAELEAGYAKLREYQLEIPDELTKRYLAKRAGRRKIEERKHRTRLIAIGSGAGAAIIVVLGVTLLVMHANAAKNWADALNRSVAAHTREGLDRATTSVAELQKSNPGILKDSRVAAAANSVQMEKLQYERDAQSAAELARKLKAAGDAAEKVNGNRAASLDDIRTAAVTLQAALKDAGAQTEKLAWADADGKLRGAIEANQGVLHAMQGKIVADVHEEMDAVSKALAAVPEDASTPDAVGDAEAKIAALGERAAAMRGTPLLDDGTLQQVAALSDRIGKRQKMLEASVVMAQAMDHIRNNSGSAKELEDGLAAFVSKFPGDRRAADFKDAITRLDAGKSLEAWHALTETFNGGFAAGAPAQTRKRLEAVSAFLAAHPACPIAAAITSYRNYLQRASDALAEKGTWQTAFADLIATPVLSELNYMQVSDGRKFYTLGDPKRTEHGMNGQVSVSFDVLDPEDLTKRVTITIDPPLTVSRAPLPAPHSKVIGDIADAVKLISADNWDTYGIDLASSIAKNKQIDSVVKAILLLQTLKTEVAVTGGTADVPGALGTVYDKAILEFSRQQPDQLPWTDPSKISEGTRQALELTAEDIPPAKDVRRKLDAAKQALFASVGLNPLTPGVLLKDDSGAWKVYTAGTALDGTTVWTIKPQVAAPGAGDGADSTAAGGMRLVKVGFAKGDNFVLDDKALQDVPQGDIAYLTRP